MENVSQPRLRLVPTDSVLPHEVADPSRERRIEARLREDGVLRDPLLVGAVADLEGYVLLDGTNRRRALEALGLPYALVQILDYGNPHVVELRTWCHATDVPVNDILQALAELEDVEISRLSPLAAPDALGEASTLAVLLDRTHRYLISRLPGAGHTRAAHLCRVVRLYEDRMARQDCDPESVEELALGLGAATPHQTLIAFPRFTRSQVVSMAIEGQLIPAGITRHVVLVGRGLRVNLGLDALRGASSEEQANEELTRHLAALHPRTYREPTILFDS